MDQNPHISNDYMFTNTQEQVSTDCKRFNLPCVITATCPHCGQTLEHDLSDGYYLSYPTANKPFEYSVYCGDCGEDFHLSKKLVLRVTLEDFEE